ncbi:pentatricopeptide repeat-containing protein At1g02060, chloroplastic [Durio zibethinus]|uniref:Pentatricopeptide repeat-containing protein At1g02060, chloroplastic n=1 Tax=Durio zibethinus TaxID=66656 RepID=A0A6P6AZA3_DURZI|nr:pentatricopeptide repeat-containing protein At1g02060, chloroplastic [Durio zibethinus]
MFTEMALSPRSHHRAGEQLFLYQSPLRSVLRCFSSRRIKIHGEGIDEQKRGWGDKKKSSTKTKRAKSMARVINSTLWSSELESSISSLSPSLSKTTVLQTLRLIKTPSKALQFFNWVQKMGFPHNTQSFFLMLEILGKERNLNAARNLLLSIEKRSNGSVKLEDKFFNSLIRSYGKAGLFQKSIKVFETMKSIGVSPSVVSFNNLLSILLERGRTNMAKSVFDEMLSTYGVNPDVYTFNILIRGFCMNSMVDEGFGFFKEMERFKCDPDVVTYNTIVDGLCRVGKVGIAHNVVRGMSQKSLDLNPNIVTYTTLVRGYCMKQDIDEALVVFQEMISRGLKPNRITYNTLIKGLSEVHKYDKIKEILEGMGEDGRFIPDTCTFNTIINAHCNAGNTDEALNVFKRMSELEVQSDSATYSVIIRSLCQIGDFEKAEEFFDELAKKKILLSDVGCTPLVAAYNPMFEYLCSNGKTKKAERVFRQLMKRGRQDPPAYKTLILGHCKEGTFKAGYKLSVLMLRRDFEPGFEIFDSLISGLLQKGEPLLALLTLEKMLMSSHLPRTPSVHSILAELLKKCCAHEAASLVTLMLHTRIRLNINLSTQTAKLLFARQLEDKAFQIIVLLYDNGYVVEMEELVGFLCQSGKLLEACKMMQFSLEKHQTVDIEMCSTVIEGLCNSKSLSEAFGLYYELVERGKHQQLRCLDNLRMALEAGGRLDEAEFVLKRIPNQWQCNDASTKLNVRTQKFQQQ